MDEVENEEFLIKSKKAFKELFAKAKNTDELHYALSLAPEFRPYKISTARDAQIAFEDYLNFLQNEKETPIKARIALAFYCHISEASGFWEVPKNMMCIADGQRYNVMPFLDLVKKFGSPEGSIAPNANKVMRSLIKFAIQLGFNELAEVFRDAFNADLRNGYAHANYALLDKGICVSSRYGSEKIINWDTFNFLLHRAINFYMVFMSVFQESLLYYNEPKIVKGYLDDRDPGSTWEIHYENGKNFIIKGGVGYEPTKT